MTASRHHAASFASHDEEAHDDPLQSMLAELSDVLDEMAERRGVAMPVWEFCEGFMTAMLCSRRPPEEHEWLPVLLGASDADSAELGPFASPGQRTRFEMNWLQRQAQLKAALESPADDLQDPRALAPALVDWRAALQALAAGEGEGSASADASADANADTSASAAPSWPLEEADIPAYGQMWALGFWAVLEQWPEDWALPRDKEIAAQMADALDCIGLLLGQDEALPPRRLPQRPGMQADGAAAKDAPTVSEQRLHDVGEAIWAVYDLYAIARALGPRQPPAVRAAVPGRNEPCLCGSGKKYKKCCGAG